MNDLHTLLSRAAADIDATPTAAVLDDDVTRGAHARRRRRGFVGSGLAVVAVATVALGASLVPTASPAAAAELVEYTAEQPPGFTIAEVPEGWHVLSSDASSLILADAGDDGADPSMVVGRIVASLVNEDFMPTSLTAETVTVDGQETLVYDLLGEDGTPSGTLGVYVPEGGGDYLEVQLPATLNWTPEIAARFADGLDVTDSAEHTVG
ncbi:hypothetical protein [Cellulomonas sp. URHE0023]|uniref:hypothetical protein n=1 Tax=Cellulomonas sp. URHE0023 TaxID=1380354 RepID=UPI000484CCA2|nr:hypothetical protein [Cellulomonas sp. URHE0023]